MLLDAAVCRTIKIPLVRALACLLAAWFLAASTTQCLADKRVALVMGNSAYKQAPKLANPTNDAGAIALLLKSAGFEIVETRNDIGIGEMRRTVSDFSERARDAEIAVIYYAGHGIEVGGTNYLVPVDATLRRDIDVEDETVSLDRLLQVMESAKRLRLVILDACRDNPFLNSMARTMASRAIGRGLARVEPVTSDTLVAFAAKAGSTAADGSGIHSPFTSALLKHIVTPGLDIRLAFGRVRDEVLERTGSKQEPFVYGSLGGKTVTLAALSKDEKQETQTVRDPDMATSRDYEATARVGTKEAWESFLHKHPDGLYADLARAQRAKLQTEGKGLQPPSASGGAISQPKPAKEPKTRSKETSKATSGGGPIYQRCMSQYASQANGDTTYFWKQARIVCAAVARNPSPSCRAGGHC